MSHFLKQRDLEILVPLFRLGFPIRPGSRHAVHFDENVRSLSEMPRRVNGDDDGGVSSGHFR